MGEDAMAAMALPADGIGTRGGPDRTCAYGWVVFAHSFGLLISDYMARQVLNAVFPLLKAEWHLSDARLGLLSGVVALMVGLLTFPLSILADRHGRVRSLVLMAVIWSLATLGCAMARTFGEMLAGRVLVGVGEAAYGSVGIALVVSVFPQRLRATLSAAFMAGGLLGQVLGVAIGSAVAAGHGWRMAFAGIGIAGLVLALAYAAVVREARVALAAGAPRQTAGAATAGLRALVGSRSVCLAYLGSGLQMLAAGALPAWLPSYFTRAYALPLDRAGRLAALLLLICGAGMVLCGMASDRLARERPDRKISLAIGYCIGTAAALALAFALPPGPAQLVLLAIAMFLVAATTGPAGAMVANLTPLAIHGTAFATLTLANNVLGLAPGPILTGRLADMIGLTGALRLLPVSCLAAAAVFALARRSYLTDLTRQAIAL